MKYQEGYCMFEQVLRLRQGFLFAAEFLWFCVSTGVPCVATRFSGFKRLPCHDIVFPCHNSAFVSLS